MILKRLLYNVGMLFRNKGQHSQLFYKQLRLSTINRLRIDLAHKKNKAINK